MRSVLALALLAVPALAELKVTEPSGSSWWVADANNTLVWNGTDPAQFSVYLRAEDYKVMQGDLAIKDLVIQSSLGRYTLNPGKLNPGNYQVVLASPYNVSDVYAMSDKFPIKPENSTLPSVAPASAAPASSSASKSAAATDQPPATGKPSSAGRTIAGSSAALGAAALAYVLA